MKKGLVSGLDFLASFYLPPCLRTADWLSDCPPVALLILFIPIPHANQDTMADGKLWSVTHFPCSSMVSKIWKLTLLLGFVVSVGHQMLLGICVNTVAIRVHGLNHGWIGLSDAVDYRLEAHATTASPSKPNGNTKIDVRQRRGIHFFLLFWTAKEATKNKTQRAQKITSTQALWRTAGNKEKISKKTQQPSSSYSLGWRDVVSPCVVVAPHYFLPWPAEHWRLGRFKRDLIMRYTFWIRWNMDPPILFPESQSVVTSAACALVKLPAGSTSRWGPLPLRSLKLEFPANASFLVSGLGRG